MKKISKKEARQQGLLHYFTGNKCLRGHVSKRYVSTGGCFDCVTEKRIERRSDPQLLKREKELARIRRNPSYRPEPQSIEIPDHIEGKEKRRMYARIYYQKNKNRLRQQAKERMIKNPGLVEKRRLYINEWSRNFRNSPEGKLTYFMRKCVYRCAVEKNKRSEKILGYSSDELKAHLERQFTKSMSWDNYGEWHIDHIIPISHFLRQGIKDPKKINCLSNLRPLCAKKNLSKNARLETIL